jgi:uncharacterized repeat protein (TIGR03803 family)
VEVFRYDSPIPFSSGKLRNMSCNTPIGGLLRSPDRNRYSRFQSSSVTDGAFPIGGVVADSQGALYGTTTLGGKNRNGTIYKLSPPATQGGAWKQNILYSFANGASGASPSGNLILTKTGKIYGAATGEDNAIVFELAPPTKSGEPWSESVAFLTCPQFSFT